MDNSYSQERQPLTGKFILYKRRWVILAVFSLISMTNEVIWISLSAITSIVKNYYNVTSLAVNWLSIIFMLFEVFLIVPSYILDKYGLKITIILGTALNGLGSCMRCIGANRNGFVYIFLGNGLAALAQCFLMFIPPKLAALWFGEHERATASAIGMLMNLLGISVGFLMSTIVPTSQDMLSVKRGMLELLISQAVLCSALMVFAVTFIEDTPPTPPSRSQALVEQLKGQNRMPQVFEGKVAWSRSGDSENVEYGGMREPNSDGSGIITLPNFRDSLLMLLKHKSFHILMQAYSIYFGLLGAFNTVLNQMVISKFPGRETDVGYLGCSANLVGVIAIFFSGFWLDRAKIYRKLAIFVIVLSALMMLVFSLLLSYYDNFVLLFISFCIFCIFSYPFFSFGLEYAADFTYPISEGTTSCVLLLVSNVYSAILTNIAGILIRNYSSVSAGYFMTTCYVVALIFILVNNPPLKRSVVNENASSPSLKI